MLTELTRAWGAYAQDQYISVTITQAGTPPVATVKAGPSLQYELAFAGTGRGVDHWQTPTDYIGSIALAADANGMVSAGWAWVSDALCALVDFRGDTAQVPLLHHSSARHRRPCSITAQPGTGDHAL